MRPTWDDGVRYELSTLHESPLPETWRLFPTHTLITGRVGGRLHVDAATFATTGDIPHIDADVGVRRAYVNADGEIALRWPIRYRLEVGLRSEEPYLAALWFEHRRPSGLALTVGPLDPPFSQERLTTSNTITFLERAQPVAAFAPSTKAGIQLSRSTDDRAVAWAFGLFGDASSPGRSARHQRRAALRRPSDLGTLTLFRLRERAAASPRHRRWITCCAAPRRSDTKRPRNRRSRRW